MLAPEAIDQQGLDFRPQADSSGLSSTIACQASSSRSDSIGPAGLG